MEKIHNAEMSTIFIKVNVGGVHFSLSEDVVNQLAYFKGILNLSSTSPTSLEDGDNHRKTDFSSDLIDRDQFHFAYILNCIRDPAYLDIEKLRSIKPELKYFQFEKFLSIMESEEKCDDVDQLPKISNPNGRCRLEKINDFKFYV